MKSSFTFLEALLEHVENCKRICKKYNISMKQLDSILAKINNKQ